MVDVPDRDDTSGDEFSRLAASLDDALAAEAALVDGPVSPKPRVLQKRASQIRRRLKTFQDKSVHLKKDFDSMSKELVGVMRNTLGDARRLRRRLARRLFFLRVRIFWANNWPFILALLLLGVLASLAFLYRDELTILIEQIRSIEFQSPFGNLGPAGPGPGNSGLERG